MPTLMLSNVVYVAFYELLYLISNAYVVCRQTAQEIVKVPGATSSTRDGGW
jgi:hypothetical protein